jgi:class 3 adenylate cyclase
VPWIPGSQTSAARNTRFGGFCCLHTKKNQKVDYDPTEISEVNNALMRVQNLATQLDIMINKNKSQSKATEKFVPSWLLKRAGIKDVCEAKVRGVCFFLKSRHHQCGTACSVNTTVAFFDIRSFTTICEGSEPNPAFFFDECEGVDAVDIMRFLNEYASQVASPEITCERGTIDKYIGDGILALFPSPERAVRCALRIQMLLSDRVFSIGAHGHYTIQVGCGIAHGEVVIGTVGDDDRMDVTVIGDVVNTASRLESLTARTGTAILCTRDVADAALKSANLGIALHFRTIGHVLPKGKKEPTEVCEIITPGDPIAVMKLTKGLPPDGAKTRGSFVKVSFF